MTQRATQEQSTRLDIGAAAREAVGVASDKQAVDIVLLDVRDVSAFADYMVILSATNVRQVNALAKDLAEAVEDRGLPLHHREGSGDSGWVLLDFADVVVHIFSEAQRSFYRLEEVWSKGKTVLHIQ